MTSAHLIRATRNCIQLNSNWISNQVDKSDFRGVMAQDARGNEVRYDDPRACRFTLDGALLRCANLSTAEGQGDYHEAIQHLRSMRKWKTIAEINDGSRHSQIIDMLRTAEAALNVAGRVAA